MFSLVDFLAQIEQSRSSLTPTGQERLEQLAYSKQKDSRKVKIEPPKPLEHIESLPARCCPEAIV